jgi:hypothetical protein
LQRARRIGTTIFEYVQEGFIGCDHDIRIEEIRKKLRVGGGSRTYPSKALGKGMGPSHPLSGHCVFVGQIKPEFHPRGAIQQTLRALALWKQNLRGLSTRPPEGRLRVTGP